jgi:sirohydrochlorin ferrochelatase
MKGIVVVGHGSLTTASGAAMIRLAARLRQRFRMPAVEAGFLNFSRPTLAQAVANAVERGAMRITIQPYFLIAGKYVQEDLPQMVLRLRRIYPGHPIDVAPCLGDHPLLIDIAQDRIRAADTHQGPTGVLLLAHGSPYPEANRPVQKTAQALESRTGYPAITAFLDCNLPTVEQAMELLIAREVRQIIVLPYFLQFGRHVREDVPALLATGRANHPGITVTQAPHIGYDLRLVSVIADRLSGSDQRRSRDTTPDL